MQNSSNSRPQSSELTAGTGFTYEDVVSAHYLASMLTEDTGPGLSSKVVTRVAFQQSAFGEPLDDLIVNATANDGSSARLSLQIKRSLKIGSGKSNTDFRSIIINSWDTLVKTDFRISNDRYGCIVQTVSADRLRSLQTICDWARASADAEHFISRFSNSGPASKDHHQIKESVETILAEHVGTDFDETKLYRFFFHFVTIQIDALHEGETTSASVVSQLQGALAESEQNRGQDLWEALQVLASQNRGRSAAFDRRNLLTALKGRFRFRGSRFLERDIALIESISVEWPKSIEDRIAGISISRPTLRSALDKASKDHRFVQVHGLPGTGKSAALKQLAKHCLETGPILFLKSDRLSGNSWQAFAQTIGLSCYDPSALLAEIGTLGSPYLFIDGIDRIEPAQRNIIIDLLHPILNSDELKDWRIIVTTRDAGIEPLRNWLSAELFAMGGVGMVQVEPFNDEEANALAEKIPELRILLFGNPQVQQITRRPFFASVLARDLADIKKEKHFTPRSEVDLAERWWKSGGYDASKTLARQRQRAIVDLARSASQRLGRPFPLSKLSDATISSIEGLIADGILKEVDPGHSVQFSHDIFFEWSFLQLLKDEEDNWIRVLSDVGEPPVLGRVVELLSQSEFAKEEHWQSYLARIETSNLRSQWMRAWLLGPLSAADFNEHEQVFDHAIDADEYKLHQKLLVWFQAERTRPNDNVLSHCAASTDLRRHEIILYADMLGWPSDLFMWQQMLIWLFKRMDRLPKTLVPHIVPIFEIWQNVLKDYPNAISKRIVSQSLRLLNDIEEADLATRLRSLVISSASTYPEPTKEYLEKVATRKRIRHEIFKDIVSFSATLAQTHPDQLAELSELQFLEELPEDTIKRQRREAEDHFEALKIIRAKPESERTRSEKLMLSSPFVSRSHDFSHWDWENLSISNEMSLYFPSSPLREPFHSLFQYHPEIALRLTCNLCNHAITAWRQLHRLDYERRGTPIPLILEFPWGTQTMWGGAHEYTWGRGWWGPKVVSSALLALDMWAFNVLESGKEPDQIIQRVLEGHESVAPLSIAICLALEARLTSETTLLLATNQRLWHADLQRNICEQSNSQLYLTGFNRTRVDQMHVEAIKKNSERLCRKLELRQLAQLFALNHNETLRKRAQIAIQQFPENLPFEYQEEREDEEHIQHLLETAQHWAEWGKQENYRCQQDPEQENRSIIYLENPKSEEPKAIEAAENYQEHLRQLALLNWVMDTFEKNAISDRLTVEEAVQSAKSLDHTKLFVGHDDVELKGMTRGAVAGTAATIFCFPDQCDSRHREWAREVIHRAYATPESVKHWNACSIIPWHPLLFVAKGLVGRIKLEPSDREAIEMLLRLIAHPLLQVSLEAVKQCFACWDVDKRFAWNGFKAGLRLCIRKKPQKGGGSRMYDPDYERSEREDILNTAVNTYFEETGYSELVIPPPAWEYAPVEKRNWYTDDFDEIDATETDKPTAMAWQDPEFYWDWYTAKDLLKFAPIDKFMCDEYLRTKFLLLIDAFLDWTLERINPSWRDQDVERRERRHTDLLQWIGQLSTSLAFVCAHLSAEDAHVRFLDKILTLKDEQCMSFLSDFVDLFICRTVLDADDVSSESLAIINKTLERVLQDRTFCRDGEVCGFDLPRIIPSLLFTKILEAGMAKRFANGDWHDIGIVMPIIDKFIKAAGWVPFVAENFLTLTEHASNYYPAEQFADQVISIFERGNLTKVGWKNTMLPARIAGMVQTFADRDHPLDIQLAQKLLRILDFLVDMGDRRSASLQLSESFKNVKLTNKIDGEE